MKQVLIILSILLSLNAMASNPDFRYPENVIKEATEQMAAASKKGDTKSTVDALVKFAIAKTSISADYMPEIISMTDSLANTVQDKVAKSLLLSLEADMYMATLDNNRYVFIAREKTDVRPQNIMEWAVDDFNDKIIELLGTALSEHEVLTKIPSDNYAEILSPKTYKKEFFPTLYDIIAHHALKMLQDIGTGRYPIYFKCGYNDFATNYHIEPAKDAKPMMVNIYHKLLSIHKDNTAAFIYNEVARIKNACGRDGYDLYKQVYEKYISSKYSTEALIEMLQSSDYSRQNYTLACKQVMKYPKYFRINEVKNFISKYEQCEAKVSVPSMVESGGNIMLDIRTKSLKEITIECYKVGEVSDRGIEKTIESGKCYKSQDFCVNYKCGSDTLTKVTFPAIEEYGRYAFVVTFTDPKTGKVVKDSNDYSAVRVSDLDIANLYIAGKNRVYAINTKTGKPIAGAILRSTKKNSSAQKTNRFGYAVIDNDAYGEYYLTYGEDRSESLYTNSIYGETSQISAVNIMTDLGVYRPGDTVHFSVVAYTTKRNIGALLENENLFISFKNANRKEIANMTLKTDKYGRADSIFVIPKEGMTGHFSISVSAKSIYNTKDVLVSEYKAPTFFVECSDEESALTDPKSMLVNGCVKTFSQFPVADAALTYKISPVYSWWNLSGIFDPIEGETRTDNNGKWSVAIPESVLNGKDYGTFQIEVLATSATGETQSMQKVLAVGNKKFMQLSDMTLEANDSARLDVSVTDIQNKIVKADCRYAICYGEKTIAEGTFVSDKPFIDLSAVPSGEYTIKAGFAGEELLNKASMVVYRANDTLPPYSTPLWVVPKEIVCDSKGHFTVPVKSSYFTSVLYVVYTNDRTLKEGVLQVEEGTRKLPLDINLSAEETATMKLFAYRNHKEYSHTITIKPAVQTGTTMIAQETFRDFITPGAKEVWRFRITNTAGDTYKGAMVAYMYDSALDKIAANPVEFYFRRYFEMQFRSRFNRVGSLSFDASSFYKNLMCPGIAEPYINMYGRSLKSSFYEKMNFCYNSAMPLKAASKTVSEDRFSLAESADCGEEEVEKVAGGTEEQPKDFNYRDPDVKSAFFMPNLVTDKDGEIVLEFTAPNVNTTWNFYAVAFTDSLKYATFSREVVANKPVMVQANLPRFVRVGDVATVKALVMNNSAETINATATIELFDPATNKVIATEKKTVSLAASASETIESVISKDVTKKYQGVGYRVKVETAEFADGEQKVIAILPATTDVVEANPFYLKENEQTVAVSLPKADEGKVTIEYCDNPTWYCVTALPSMVSTSETALAYMRNYYISSVAGGIVSSNADIATAIKAWDKSGELTSNLNKNTDLKTIDLNNTPWLTDAERETLNMQHLVELTEPQVVSGRKELALRSIAGLQGSNGGIRWFKSCSESRFVTLAILGGFADLDLLGYLDNDAAAKEIIRKGISFVDNDIIKELEKYNIKKTSYPLYFDYILIRSMYPTHELPNKLKKVKDEVLNYAKNQWGNFSIEKKAEAALLLAYNGETATATDIIESLRQHARKDAFGYYWDVEFRDKLWLASKVLMAFYKVNPEDKDLDNIRRWILSTKETRNWGESPAACDAINAILATGTRWTNQDRKAPEIKVGETIVKADADKYFGYIRQSFPIAEVSGKDLTIKRYGYNPAWGATYLQYSAPMSEVSKADSDVISIEKKFYRYGEDGVLESVPATEFRLGDKIQVRLTVNVTKDMNYVALTDERPAAFEPVDQVPVYDWRDGIYTLRETRDSSTNIFISGLPKGTFILKYDVYVNNAGTFSSGIAEIQCQYAPQMVAHSAGAVITCK